MNEGTVGTVSFLALQTSHAVELCHFLHSLILFINELKNSGQRNEQTVALIEEEQRDEHAQTFDRSRSENEKTQLTKVTCGVTARQTDGRQETEWSAH